MGGGGLNENRVTDMSSGISPAGPSKKVRAAVRKAIKNIRVYPEREIARLESFFSSKFGLAKGGILFANSIRELIYLIPAVFKPKRVLVAGPALSIYEEASFVSGAGVEYCNAHEESGFTTDVEGLKREMEGVDLLFIANPNRVTGRLTDRKVLYEISAFAADRGAVVVVDESLVEFTGDDNYCNGLSDSANIIVLRTTANFYGLPGLELAYAVSSAAVISELKRKKHWDLNTLSLEAARAALKDKTYKKLTTGYISEEKKLLVRALEKNSCIRFYASDSNMLLIRLVCAEEHILNSLTREGFLIKACSDIEGLDGSYFMFSVMTHDINQKFMRIIRQVRRSGAGFQDGNYD